MGFHLTPKKVLLPFEPWGMRMQWEHTTLIKEMSFTQQMIVMKMFVKKTDKKMHMDILIYFYSPGLKSSSYPPGLKSRREILRYSAFLLCVCMCMHIMSVYVPVWLGFS